MNHSSRKLALNICALLLSVLLLGACSKSKDDNKGGGYPKEVNIEYRVKKTGGNLNNVDILLTNAGGGNDIIDNAALPFTKKFKKTVNEWEVIQITASSTVPGSIQMEIVVNDEVVESKPASGNTVVHGQVGYQFKP